MAQQNYSRNVPFNTYTLEQLTADNINDWTWTGRTLAGYISGGSETVISLGDQLMINTSTAELSGAWELNKLNLSVYIDNAGPDSYVEIETGTMYYDSPEQNCRPLTDETIKNITLAYNNDIVKFWYNSYISCIIHPGENHTISAVYFDQNGVDVYDNPTNQGEVSSVTCPVSIHILNPAFTHTLINKSLSVYLAEGGIMHYYSNKNTVNSNHPTLDD